MTTPADAERRLVTVLYADLAGHTELITRLDPEDWRVLLQRYFAEIAAPIQRFGGTLEKFIGDAVFAVFGVPRVHEDDAARAVRAAVEMQEVLSRLNPDFTRELGVSLALRIGIATGEAVAPGTTGGDPLVIGDLTTLAERLQREAPPGGIVLSERTYRLTGTLVEGDPLGPLDLKGFPESHRAVRLRRLRPVMPPTDVGWAAPLVDRERELAELVGVGERLRGGRGQVVCLIGEAGLGKSRLVAELRARLDPAIGFVAGRCHEFTQGVSHGVILQLLRGVLGLGDLEPVETARSRLDETLQRLFGTAGPEIRPAVEHLMGLDSAHLFEERTRGLGPEDVRQALFGAVTAFWEQAAQAPLVLLVEDLHWVDAASADALGRLFPVTERVPLLLLCAFRPERHSLAWEFRQVAERDFPHRYQEIRLGPLSPEKTEELAAALLERRTLPVALKESVAQRAEGNPFYVEEVVRSLGASGGTPRVPDTLQGVLQARLDALPPPTRYLLQTASVIGRTFPLRLLRMLASPEGELGAHLSLLQRTDFLYEVQRIPEATFTFRHGLLQEATYQTLLRKDRGELHRRLAEVLESEAPVGPQLAVAFYHFLHGGVWGKAVAFGEHAAVWARDTGAHEEALSNFQQVLEILGGHPEAASPEAPQRIREARGDLLSLLGRFEEARADYVMLREQALTTAQRAHAERKIAEAYRRAGEMKRAIEHLQEALRILTPGADPVEEAWAHLDLGYLEDLTGEDPRSVLAHCERARVLAEGGDPLLNARVFRLYTIAYVHRGDMAQAMLTARRAVQYAEAAKNDLEIAIAHNNLGDVLKHRGELAQALDHVQQGLTAAARLEPRRAAYQLAILRMTQGELHLARGEWAAAQDALEVGLRSLAAGAPAPRIRLEMLCHLAEALIPQGQIARALQLLDEAQSSTVAYPLLRFAPLVLRIRAEALLAAEDVERAEEACLEGLAAAERHGSEVERPALLLVRAQVAMRQGRIEEASRRLAEAVAILGERGQGPDLGRIFLEEGRLHLARREKRDAAVSLRRAREQFQRLGALAYVEQIDGLLELTE